MMRLPMLRRVGYLRQSPLFQQQTYQFRNPFAPASTEENEDAPVVVTESEYKVLNVNSKSSVKTLYLQYKKHVNFYQPHLYKGKDGEEKINALNEVYSKIMQSKLQDQDALTEEDKTEMDMLTRMNFGIIEMNSMTLTEKLQEIDDTKYDWIPREPQHYILFLFLGWMFLGTISFTIEEW